MAVKDLGLVPDEDLKRIPSPLNPEPIADLLGKIPGVGTFLKSVQQQTSPKGLMGPGVIAQIMSGLQQKATGTGSPQDFYDKSIGTSETIAALATARRLPSVTLLQRLLGGAGLPMVEHAIQEGGQNPGTGLLKGVLGAGIQAATEGVTGAVKQFGMQRAANTARTAHEGALGAHEAQVADDIAGDRYQRALDLTAHRKDVANVRTENAAGKNAQSLAEQGATRQYNDQVAQIRTSDAQRIRTEKAAYQTNKKAALAAHDTETQRLQQSYEDARGMHAGQAAEAIMEDAKRTVPEWRDFPSNLDGVINGVLGKGQKILSETYASALHAAKDTARGKDLILPLNDIRTLKVPMKGLASTPENAGAAALPTDGVVDAGDAIEYLNRMGRKNRDWGVYRRTVDALANHPDDLGVSEEARTAYRGGQKIIEAVDQSGALEPSGGQTVLNTDKLFALMHKVKGIDIIRHRSEEDFLNSPIVQATRGTPQPPALPSAPEIDPFVPPVKTPLPQKPQVPPFLARPTPEPPIKLPFTPQDAPFGPDATGEIAGKDLGTRWQRARVGGLVGALAGMGTGAGHSLYYSPPAVAGAITGAALPNQWVTKAPGTEPMIELYGKLAQLFGAGAREEFVSPLADAIVGPPDTPSQDR